MERPSQLFIIYSNNANAFYKELAQRLATACNESGRAARLTTAAELIHMGHSELKDATLAVVNPFECFHWVIDKEALSARLRMVHRKLMVLAEAIETRWFEDQFRLPVSFDALVDVGFHSQREKMDGYDIPYRFLFHAPTSTEREKIQHPEAQKRPIPWALVGHQTTERLKFATELMRRIAATGFVFLPQPGFGVRKKGEAIGPSGMISMLSRTEYYVWISHHEFSYYESFRFIEAILAGAMPIKIDASFEWQETTIPGIFPSLETFVEAVYDEGFVSLRESAAEFYLSQGLLADRFEEVLESV